MTLYGSNDMVRLGCNDCAGCSSCCRGMGDSIILDPYDIWQLETHTGENFAQLIQEKIELHVQEGLILPSLKMQEKEDACYFLDTEGRCGIHDYRPGLCRLFPLGRKYGEDGLFYFPLEDACSVVNRTKIKIKKWLAVPELSQYEDFLTAWYGLRKGLLEKMETEQSDDYAQKINVKMLEIFYQRPYCAGNFYMQFAERKREMEGINYT